MWGEVEAEYGMVVGGGRGCKVVCEGGRLERWGGKCRVCGRVCVAGDTKGSGCHGACFWIAHTFLYYNTKPNLIRNAASRPIYGMSALLLGFFWRYNSATSLALAAS